MCGYVELFGGWYVDPVPSLLLILVAYEDTLNGASELFTLLFSWYICKALRAKDLEVADRGDFAVECAVRGQ